MLEEIKKYAKKDTIVFLPEGDLCIKDSLSENYKNIIVIKDIGDPNLIIDEINKSKIGKIYLVGNNDFYRVILPRIRKNIEVCWIYRDSFSALSNGGVRFTLHTIFEFIDRDLVTSIGCVNKETIKVFENAGYKCEYISLKMDPKKHKYNESNNIGILSNDFDPNNNFYNQLAALTFVDYDVCKFNYVMKATKDFIKRFNIKVEKHELIDEIIANNFVNLYVNFTNTNPELIQKSFNFGVPVILGNTDIFDDNSYLKEHLVMKCDDDINEIVDKINFVKNNRQKILDEYFKKC